MILAVFLTLSIFGGSVKAGDVVGGKFQFISKLGEGDMGVTFVVADPQEIERSVLKICPDAPAEFEVHRQLSLSKTPLHRIVHVEGAVISVPSNDAKSSSATTSGEEAMADLLRKWDQSNFPVLMNPASYPGFIHSLRYTATPGPEDSIVGLVMQLCDSDLDALFKTPHSSVKLFSIFRQTLQGIVELHAAGYAHRDLTLGNVLMCHSRAKVSDLGVSIKFGKDLSLVIKDVSDFAENIVVPLLCSGHQKQQGAWSSDHLCAMLDVKQSKQVSLKPSEQRIREWVLFMKDPEVRRDKAAAALSQLSRFIRIRKRAVLY